MTATKSRPPGMQIVSVPTISTAAHPPAKYDEAEFLVGGKGTGKPGEIEKEWFKIHEGYVADARKIVDSKKFPYKSITDLYRHAAVRHIHWLEAIEPEVEGSVLHELQQINEVVAREQFHIWFTKNIDGIASTIADILELPNGKVEVGRMLRKIRKHIDRMRPSFYKSYYEKMYTDRFGPYERAGLVLLSAGGDEEDDATIDSLPEPE